MNLSNKASGLISFIRKINDDIIWYLENPNFIEDFKLCLKFTTMIIAPGYFCLFLIIMILFQNVIGLNLRINWIKYINRYFNNSESWLIE